MVSAPYSHYSQGPL